MENIGNITIVGELEDVEEPIEEPIFIEVENPCWEIDEKGYVIDHYLMSDSEIEKPYLKEEEFLSPVGKKASTDLDSMKS